MATSSASWRCRKCGSPSAGRDNLCARCRAVAYDGLREYSGGEA